MTMKHLFAVAAAAFSLSVGAVSAQIAPIQPAEFPPASYKGKQYVDSKGCVFIRAGIDGNISWIPQVTRARKIVCGAQPTFARAPAPAPKPAAAPPVELTVAPPVAEPVVVAAAPPRPKPQPIPRRAAPKPKPVPKPAPVVRRPAPAPAPAEVLQVGGAVDHGYGAGITRHDEMLLVWTNTVPRRLIDRTSGKDVTAKVPLVYPYLSLTEQRRSLGEVKLVKRNGKVMKKIIRNRAAKPAKVRKPVYSSRSKPQAAAPKVKVRVPAGARYVQVGVFGNKANAQATAQRIARMGYAARIGSYRKGGKTYMSVQAGPFEGAKPLSRAVAKLRGAGFSDAFARK